MHEKYDATAPGERGGGGEYEPQVGFGWTNGAALWLLRHYGAELDAGEFAPHADGGRAQQCPADSASRTAHSDC